MTVLFPPSSTIGSVLPSPAPYAVPPLGGASLWALWSSAHRTVAAYGSARAALAALLACRRIGRVWLPSYCCPALADAARDTEVAWYGVGGGLETEEESLRSLRLLLRPGDAVVSVAFFGRPSDPALVGLAAARPDVLWIEDRSQAVDAGGPAWADVHLHSPRKLVGVADGGVLTSDGCLPAPVGAPSPRAGAAQLARRQDLLGQRPDAWFPAFRRQEAEFDLEPTPMTPETRESLERTDAADAAAKRSSNAAVLQAHLPGIALWPHLEPGVPLLAFPVRVPDPAGAAASLAARGVYCARHWASLPSDPRRFPAAHALSASLLSLPCDQHHDGGHMLRVAAALRGLGLVQAARDSVSWVGRHAPRRPAPAAAGAS